MIRIHEYDAYTFDHVASFAFSLPRIFLCCYDRSRISQIVSCTAIHLIESVTGGVM